MANDTTIYTTYPDAHVDERVRYFDGQFLTSQDFVDEQRYHADRLRRALDHLSVSGVGDGLTVTPIGPWKIKLSPGLAIDATGRQLVVLAARESLDVPKDIPGGILDLALYYAEVESRVHGGASDEDGTRGASRFRELPALEFYAPGQPPTHPEGVPLARLRITEGGTVTIDSPSPVRRASGLRLPSSGPDAPTLRAGFARSQLAALTGDLQITGKLGIGTADPEAELDVRGIARVTQLSVREQPLRIAGDEATFYPIVFRDIDASAGQCILEISRASAQTDGANAGSLSANLRWHAGDGQGSDVLTLDVAQTRRFLANARLSTKDRLLVVWLRGNRSYVWRAGQRVELVDFAAATKTIAGEKLDPRTTLEPAFDRDRYSIGPALDAADVRANLNVAGDIAYTGRLASLDVAERPSATLRINDLLLGHSTRRGSPGRAIVDYTTALVINYGGDWSQTTINSKAQISGDLQLDGDAKFNKDLTLTAGNLKLPAGGLTVAKPSAFTDQVTLTRDIDHLRLIRSKAVTGGARTFLELYQDDATPAAGPETYPAIRFHHFNRYWHRLEARTTGFHFRSGDLTNDSYTNIFAQDIKAAGTLTVDKPATFNDTLTANKPTTFTDTLTANKPATFNDAVRISRDSEHLQLIRPKSTSGGVKLMLELYQDDTSPATVPETGISLRFHQSNRYFHRIEARGAGFHLRTGDLASNNYTELSAANIYANSLHVTTGKAERLRMIRGTVSDGGSRQYGSGFSVEKDTNKGLWKITFDAAFEDVPSVVVTQQYPNDGSALSSGDTRDNAIVIHVDASHAWIKTGNNGGDQTWRKFHFIAVGP